MAIQDDVAIDGSGNIYYTGAAHGAAGAGYYTVIQLHRYLQDLADDAAASGDDLIDITSVTPSDRSTDNIITVLDGYRLDDSNGSATDPISEHLYDGSIIQQEDGSIWDGLVVIAAEGMDLQIIQNGALVANDFWNTVPNGETEMGLNRDSANGISHRFMLLVNNAGTEIDGRRIVGITRVVGKTYSEFKVNGTARGNNVLALTYADDLNNQTADATLATYTGISNQEGYRLIDIDNNGNDEAYYSEWNRDVYTANQLYERLKWLTAAESGGSASSPNATLYGLDGTVFRGITHQVNYSGLSGTFDVGPITFSNGATAQCLASNDNDKLWLQVLTGVIPSSGTVSQSSPDAASATVTGLTERTVSTPFVGVSTGSALIGAYGWGMEAADAGPSDLFTPLEGTGLSEGSTIQPPNNVSFSVLGLVSGEDRVLVGPEDGAGDLREDQCVVGAGETVTVTSGSVSSAGSGAGVVVLATGSEAIGNGTPSEKDTRTSGTLRLLDADGVYQIINYTSRTPGTGEIVFNGCTATGSWTSAAGNNAFISYIDVLATSTGESYTVVYSGTPRTLFVRVRDGGTAGDLEGIKTFQTTGTLGSAGGSTTVIRTADA